MLSCLLFAGLAACAQLDDPDAQADDPEAQLDDSAVATSSTSQEIETGCGNVPPCACALKGTPVCDDDDGDSVLNLNDNCPLASNAGQANCDGDVYGDACDGDNSYVTSQHYALSFDGYNYGPQFCQGPPNFRRLAYNLFERDLQTLHMSVQFCGPSGNGTEERTSSTYVYQYVGLIVTALPC
jgi:hypothetical protein